MPIPNIDSVFTYYNPRGGSGSTITYNISSTSTNRVLVSFAWFLNAGAAPAPPNEILWGGVPMSFVTRYGPAGGEAGVIGSLWTIAIADNFSGNVAMSSTKTNSTDAMLVMNAILSGVSIPASSWTGRGSTTISGTGPYGIFNVLSLSTNSDLMVGCFANNSGSTTTNQITGNVAFYPGFSNITCASTDGASGTYVPAMSLYTGKGSGISSQFSTDPGPARWRNFAYLASGTTFESGSVTTVGISSVKTGTNASSWTTFGQDLASDVNAYYMFINGAGCSAYSTANPVVAIWVSDVTAEQIWTGPYNGSASNAVDIWRAHGFTTGSNRTIAIQRQVGSGYAPIAFAGFALTSVSTTTMNSATTGQALSTSTNAPSVLTISGTLIPAAILLTGVNTQASIFSAQGPVGGSGQDSVGTLSDDDTRRNNWASGVTSPHTWTVDADASGRFYSWAAVVIYGGGSAPPSLGGVSPYYLLNQTRFQL